MVGSPLRCGPEQPMAQIAAITASIFFTVTKLLIINGFIKSQQADRSFSIRMQSNTSPEMTFSSWETYPIPS